MGPMLSKYCFECRGGRFSRSRLNDVSFEILHRINHTLGKHILLMALMLGPTKLIPLREKIRQATKTHDSRLLTFTIIFCILVKALSENVFRKPPFKLQQSDFEKPSTHDCRCRPPRRGIDCHGEPRLKWDYPGPARKSRPGSPRHGRTSVRAAPCGPCP